MRRDFSETARQQLLSLVSQVENEQWCEFTDWIGDGWYAFESLIGQLDIQKYVNNINEYHKKVIDKNDASLHSINNIFHKVNNVDQTYRVRFEDVQLALEKWRQAIDQLSDIVDPSQGKFHAEYMGGPLKDLLTDVVDTSTKIEAASQPPEDATTDILNRLIDILKSLLFGSGNVLEGHTELNVLFAQMLAYIQTILKIWGGKSENGWKQFASLADLGDESIKVWLKLHDFLKKVYNLSQGIFDDDSVAIFGVDFTSDVLSAISSLLNIFGAEHISIGERIDQLLSTFFGAIATLFVDIDKFVNDLSGSDAQAFLAMIKSILTSLGQLAESLEKYASDGTFDLGDIGKTGVESSIAGLSAIVNIYAGWLIKLFSAEFPEAAEKYSAENISDRFIDSLEKYGQEAGKFIISHPNLYEHYRNGNAAMKLLIFLHAVATVRNPYLANRNKGLPGDIVLDGSTIYVTDPQGLDIHWAD